jgi:hypothetical protein
MEKELKKIDKGRSGGAQEQTDYNRAHARHRRQGVRSP